jgi:cytidine deaminase
VGHKQDAEPKEWDFCPPCGVCRQVMAEFADPDSFQVYLGRGEEIRSFNLRQLLPESFSLKREG